MNFLGHRHFVHVETCFFAFFLLLTLVGCQSGKDAKPEQTPEQTPERVVSFTPALTETVFALGVGEKLVGVTKHCEYPPQARGKSSIGSIFEPNYEALLALRPDCVLIPDNSSEIQKFCETHGIRTVMLPQRTVEDVFSTISTLGTLFEREPEAGKLAEELRNRLDSVRSDTPQRVLFVLSRDFESRDLEEIYIAGTDGLCTPLLELAGGQNVYEGSSEFPKISPEAVVRLNPDVILENVPKSVREKHTDEELRAVWTKYRNVSAVRSGRIYFLNDAPPLLPSPSMVDWTEKTARILHP